MTLKELNIGESAVIRTVGGDGALRQHFFGYGRDTGSRSDRGKAGSYGRSDGTADPWI